MEWLWGLITRLFGLGLMLQFGSALAALPMLAGPRGIEPAEQLFAAYRRDLGPVLGWLRLPSLLAWGASDHALRAVALLGLLCGLAIATGALGAHTWVAFALAWVLWLSIMNASPGFFWFPWDGLAAEIALLGCLLPGLHPLPEVAALHEPGPAAVFLLHWLLFRVMFGMGLRKFRELDDATRDGTWAHQVLSSLPMPTTFGFLWSNAPMAVHRLCLLVMFVVEVPMPLTQWVGGTWARVVGVSYIVLQLWIWLFGGFGTFNTFTATLALVLWVPVPWAEVPLWAWGIAGLTLPYLLWLDTWSYRMWPWHPDAVPGARLVRWAAPLYRVLAPWRLFHAYGVFGPRREGPPLRLVFQLGEDGQAWHDVVFPHGIGPTDQMPRHVAPWHPRLDQMLWYTQQQEDKPPLVHFDPTASYLTHPFHLREKVVQHLMWEASPVRGYLGLEGDFPLARLTLWRYGFNDWRTWRATGEVWHRELVSASAPIARRPREEWATQGIRERYEPELAARLRVVDGRAGILEQLPVAVGDEVRYLRVFVPMHTHPLPVVEEP